MLAGLASLLPPDDRLHCAALFRHHEILRDYGGLAGLVLQSCSLISYSLQCTALLFASLPPDSAIASLMMRAGGAGRAG